MNIPKNIDYWRTGSDEDWEVAVGLVQEGKLRHGLFFLHLAMEKLIKAHVCRVTEEHPPRIHNLIQLVKRANITLDQEQANILQLLNSYCMEGRYAEERAPPPTQDGALIILKQSMEIRAWLIQQF